MRLMISVRPDEVERYDSIKNSQDFRDAITQFEEKVSRILNSDKPHELAVINSLSEAYRKTRKLAQ